MLHRNLPLNALDLAHFPYQPPPIRNCSSTSQEPYIHAIMQWLNSCLFSSFTSGPPKALDEDETEFLDKLETVSLFVLHPLPISILFSFLLNSIVNWHAVKERIWKANGRCRGTRTSQFPSNYPAFPNQVKLSLLLVFLFQIIDIFNAGFKFMTALWRIVC